MYLLRENGYNVKGGFFVDSFTEQDKTALQEEMIKGYQEMAELNLKIAEEFFAAENDLPGDESAET